MSNATHAQSHSQGSSTISARRRGRRTYDSGLLRDDDWPTADCPTTIPFTLGSSCSVHLHWRWFLSSNCLSLSLRLRLTWPP